MTLSLSNIACLLNKEATTIVFERGKKEEKKERERNPFSPWALLNESGGSQ